MRLLPFLYFFNPLHILETPSLLIPVIRYISLIDLYFLTNIPSNVICIIGFLFLIFPRCLTTAIFPYLML